MSRRLLAVLIAGAIAAVICFVWSRLAWPSRYLPILITTALVGLAFLVAGIAAWQRWPASRLGLLFTIVGYATCCPTLVNLPIALAFTIGNLTGISGAALAHLALAWPSGRLRSRFEGGWSSPSTPGASSRPVSMLFWNPRSTAAAPAARPTCC